MADSSRSATSAPSSSGKQQRTSHPTPTENLSSQFILYMLQLVLGLVNAAPGVWDVPVRNTQFVPIDIGTHNASLDAASLVGPARSPLALVSEFFVAMARAKAGLPNGQKMGLQAELLVQGTSSIPHSRLHLETTLTIRGALVQKTSETLCRLLNQPDLNLPRQCSRWESAAAPSSFRAATYIYFPARTLVRPPSADGSARLEMAALPALSSTEQLAASELLQTSHRLLVKAAHGKGTDLASAPGRGMYQVDKKQHALILKLALRALATLPTPFTMLERYSPCIPRPLYPLLYPTPPAPHALCIARPSSSR